MNRWPLTYILKRDAGKTTCFLGCLHLLYFVETIDFLRNPILFFSQKLKKPPTQSQSKLFRLMVSVSNPFKTYIPKISFLIPFLVENHGHKLNSIMWKSFKNCIHFFNLLPILNSEHYIHSWYPALSLLLRCFVFETSWCSSSRMISRALFNFTSTL